MPMFSSGHCFTLTGSQGRCIPIQQCPKLLSLLHTGPQEHKFVAGHLCSSREKGKWKVCCEHDPVTDLPPTLEEEITEKRLPPSTPKTIVDLSLETEPPVKQESNEVEVADEEQIVKPTTQVFENARNSSTSPTLGFPPSIGFSITSSSETSDLPKSSSATFVPTTSSYPNHTRFLPTGKPLEKVGSTTSNAFSSQNTQVKPLNAEASTASTPPDQKTPGIPPEQTTPEVPPLVNSTSSSDLGEDVSRPEGKPFSSPEGASSTPTADPPLNVFDPEFDEEELEGFIKPEDTTSAPTRVECGIAEDPILNEDPGIATIKQWPWIVSIFFGESKENARLGCVGTLISLTHVITSTACIRQNQQKDQMFELRFGALGLRDAVVCSKKSSCIKSAKVKGIFNHSLGDTDANKGLSILVLEEPVSYRDWVRPVCLSFQESVLSVDLLSHEIKTVTAGWQQQDLPPSRLSSPSYHFRQVLPSSACENFYPQSDQDIYLCTSRVATEPIDHVCTDLLGMGAPLVSYEQGKPSVLLGVLRYEDSSCGSPRTSAYLDVRPYLSWIFQIMIQQ